MTVLQAEVAQKLSRRLEEVAEFYGGKYQSGELSIFDLGYASLLLCLSGEILKSHQLVDLGLKLRDETADHSFFTSLF